jgi:hypothetical protein
MMLVTKVFMPWRSKSMEVALRIRFRDHAQTVLEVLDVGAFRKSLHGAS